jgi:hypothetical protein
MFRLIGVFLLIAVSLLGFAQLNMDSIIIQVTTTSPEAKVLDMSNEQNGYNNSLPKT